MTCRKIHKLIPLAAGEDLRPRQARAVMSHIDACPACRKELADFRRAMGEIRAAANAERAAEWNSGEWDALMSRVNEAADEARAGEGRKAPGRVLWPRWAAASALGAFLCLIVLGVLFKGPALRTQGSRGSQTTNASAASRQDKLAITLVSPETGLQVVWFLDKNFDWKGDQE
jgi:anti-sigma factor RsiW